MKTLRFIVLTLVVLTFVNCEQNMPNNSTEITQSNSPLGFSVSSSKQVFFSSGNLQYNINTKKWRFAENQIDYVGVSYDSKDKGSEWIDLFSWGTGHDPRIIRTDISDYQTFFDWGINKIGNDKPHTWRTLTFYEWIYILYHRTNAQKLYGIAKVDSVNGLIILPDGWNFSSEIKFKSGFSKSEYNYALNQAFTIEEWKQLESNGAVFLPSDGFYGEYWSSTNYPNTDYAYAIGFVAFKFYPAGNFNCNDSLSVRLVKDIAN